MAVLTQGEGWHNYHHSFPWDYKASEYGYFFNNSTRIINILEGIGLVYNLKEASEKLIKRKVASTGDGSHPLWGFGDKDMDKETYESLRNNEE